MGVVCAVARAVSAISFNLERRPLNTALARAAARAAAAMGKRKGGRAKAFEPTTRPSSKPAASVQLPAAALAMPLVPPGGTRPRSDSKWLQPEVRTLLEDDEGDAMLMAGPILTRDECASWIAWGESTGFALEKHAATANIAHRDNGRLAVESVEVAQAIFARLRPWIPAEVAGRRPVGCNPNIRLYRYEVGQRFGPHIDQANRLAGGALTEFTVLLYLNEDGLEGGETAFHGIDGLAEAGASAGTLRIAPRAGAVLVHAHGARCLTHEGAAVTAGTKYLLRTDVAYA